MAVFDETNTTDTTVVDPVVTKRLADKDAFIETLKAENAQAREAVAAEERKRKALEEVLLKQQADPNANPDTRAKPAVEAPSDADLAARIAQVTREERERERVQSNIDTVAQKLIETYGSEEKAREVVAAKAKELGVTPKFLQSIAATSPNAFFKQMDITPSTKTNIVPNASKGTVNTSALGVTHTGNEPEPGTYKYYQKLKDEKGMAYFLSPKVQNEMHKAAMEKGDGFYA